MNLNGTNLSAQFINDNISGLYSEEGTFLEIDGVSTFYKWEEMKFHSSIDWLIPVIEKIKEEYSEEISNRLAYGLCLSVVGFIKLLNGAQKAQECDARKDS